MKITTTYYGDSEVILVKKTELCWGNRYCRKLTKSKLDGTLIKFSDDGRFIMIDLGNCSAFLHTVNKA
jgi:hypothetical protein